MKRRTHVYLMIAVWLILFVGGAIGSFAHAQTYNLFRPANGILKGATSTYVTTPATSADVISLWTATCNSTTFLRGDGQCQTPSGAGIGTVTSVALTWASSGISISGSPITSSGTLALSGTLNVASGGTGAATLTGLLEGNGTGAIDPAESADVISLWTGTCNSTTFLRADGSCQTVAGTTDASTLTTGTLADARLSSNVPLKNTASTFTAINTFTNTSGNIGPVIVSNTGPTYGWIESDASTDEKRWRAFVSGGDFCLSTLTDADGAGANAICSTRTGTAIDSVAVTATALTHNGNAVLNTTSGLNGTNLTSGTVADARLSGNVALKNVANQSFSVVGNNTMRVQNSSTGFSLLGIDTNGLPRGDLCSSTVSGDCSTADIANDTSIRFRQRLLLTDNLGSTQNAVAIFDSALINFAATDIQANFSRINTVANTGRTAYGKINASAGTLSNSLNVTSVTKFSAGSFSLNLTAAGFTTTPVCTISGIAAGRSVGIETTSTTAANVSVCSSLGAPCSLVDQDVYFICHGQ